jgi:hypothetical protein
LLRPLQPLGQRPFVQRLPGLDPGRPVVAERRAAQALVHARRFGVTALHDAAAAEPERIHRQQAARLALGIQRVRVQHHLHLALQAAHAPCRGVAAQPGVDIAADDAVQRRGRQRGQAFVRGVPALRRAPAQQEAIAGEERLHGFEERPRGGFVEHQLRRVEQAHLVGAQVPVHRRQQAPGQLADIDAVRHRLPRRPGQQAGAALQPQRARQRTLVRRRQAPFVTLVARPCRQARQQGLQAWQRQRGQGLAAGLGQRRSERNQQVHRTIIPAADRSPGRRDGRLGKPPLASPA